MELYHESDIFIPQILITDPLRDHEDTFLLRVGLLLPAGVDRVATKELPSLKNIPYNNLT